MLDHATGNGKHPLIERGPDLYETPPCAVRALMTVETLPPVIWEPACGPGAIVSVLRESGRKVIASDLGVYGCPASRSQVDFLNCNKAPLGCFAILTNPPYAIAGAFVAHALKLVPDVIMLLRLGFLESVARNEILDGGRLRRIHVFRNRLPMMHRASWTGKKASSAMAFAWFCWSAEKGPTVLDRISWEDN
jgi:hypothetical protein